MIVPTKLILEDGTVLQGLGFVSPEALQIKSWDEY